MITLRNFSVRTLGPALEKSRVLAAGIDSQAAARQLWDAACSQRVPRSSDDIIDFADFVYEMFLDGPMEEPRGTAGLRKIRSLLEPFLSRSDLIEAMNDIERSWSLSHEPPTPDEVERWRETWRRENPAAHRRNVFIWTAFAVAGAGAIVGWTLWTALGGDGTASAGTTILAAVQAAVVVAAVGGLLGVLLRAIRREPETETQHFIV